MQELRLSIKKGITMSKGNLSKGLQILGTLSLIASIIGSPFATSSLNNTYQKGLAWFGFACLWTLFLIILALTPYYGMRQIKEDVEKQRKSLEMELDTIKPLAELRDKQSQSPRPYIYPFCSILDSIDICNLNKLKLQITFISQLLFEIEVAGMTGNLGVIGYNETQGVHFIKFPAKIHSMQITNSPISITEEIQLTDDIKANLKKARGIWEQTQKPQFIKLTLKMYRKEGDPIDFDPSDSNDQVLRLCTSIPFEKRQNYDL